MKMFFKMNKLVERSYKLRSTVANFVQIALQQKKPG